MRDIIRGGAVGYGLLAAGVSGLAAFAFALLALVDANTPATMATVVAASLLALGWGIGLPLALAGWQSLQGQASLHLRLPAVWLAVLFFVACLGSGALILQAPALTAILLPPVHVVASALPALILIAAILPPLQAGGADLTRRSAFAMFAYGGLAATVIAMGLELFAALGVMALATGATAVLPGGRAAMEQLSWQLQSPALLTDPERLVDVFVSPSLVLGLGLLVAVVTPLIEETVKSLGVWVEGSITGRLGRGQAFAFGILVGCGFSFVEALFYGSAGLPHVWTSAVLLRSATTVIHAASTGLVALGWYEVWNGQAIRSLRYLAAGIGLHMVWNGLAGLSALAGLRLFGDGASAQSLAMGLAGLVGALLIATFLAAIALLAVLTRRLRTTGVASP